MVSRALLVATALLLTVLGSQGRELKQLNYGVIVADTDQYAANLAVNSKYVNQANVNQNAQAAGYKAAAGNVAVVSQTNPGRKLQQDNSGYIVADTDQYAVNIADGSSYVNQANVNQNAQAAGYKALAANAAYITQKNGRKLQQDNSGYILADTDQYAVNIADGSSYVNQANVNQNAQAAGYKALASNYAAISQENGRKLKQDNSGYILADTDQYAVNSAIGSKYVNQANVNQNAQAAGYGAIASNYAEISQENGRKLKQVDNSGVIIADTDQYAANVAKHSSYVNQANANQNAQAAGYGAIAANGAVIDQYNGRKLQQDNSGVIIADTDQFAANVAKHSSYVNQANANQNAQAAGKKAVAANGAVIGQYNGRKLQQDNSGVIIADTDQYAANVAKHSSYVNQANANQNAQAAGKKAVAANGAVIYQANP